MPYREGFALAGAWLIEHEKDVAYYPAEGANARIRAERVSEAALAYLVRNDTTEQTVTVQALRARLSTFEAIRGASRVAAPGRGFVFGTA